MAKVKSKLPNIKTYEYNCMYSAALETLTLKLDTETTAVRFPGGGGMMINRGRVI